MQDRPDTEPEIKYLVEDLCEAFQEGVAVFDARGIKSLVFGKDVAIAEALRSSFEKGFMEVGAAYRRYCRQAGKHFAYGDSALQSKLARQLYSLTTEVVEVIQNSSDDAIAGIRPLPGSFQQYKIVSIPGLIRKTESARHASLTILESHFDHISTWAVAIHTLPPLPSPEQSLDLTEVHETGGFFKRIKSPFHRRKYSYEELTDPHFFRLVRIKTDRPYVTCDIEIFHLRDPPPFQALSYCWGKSGQNSDIWCNDRLFKVSSNLKKGLQRLHTYSAWHASRSEWFWIDQICINQEDFAERTNQVRLMRAIYQQAQNTVIWLGPDDGNAGAALSLTADIYQVASHDEEEELPDMNTYKVGDTLASPRKVEVPPPDDKRWAALPRFLELAWFERCWIIQEVVVSKGDPIMLCGGHQYLWPRFQKAMAWLTQNGGRHRLERLKLINSISDLSSSRDVWELQSLLHLTRPFLATDSRDKIFALMGLAGEIERPDEWPRELAPNYNRTPRDVYTEVTHYCIRKTGTLSILSQVDHLYKHTDLEEQDHPSWVPQWNCQPTTTSLSAFSVSRNERGWKMLIERFNRASKDMRVSLDTPNNSSVLRLAGIKLDTVESCLRAAVPPLLQQDHSSQSSNHALPNIQDPRIASFLRKVVPEYFALCRTHLPHLPADSLAHTFFQTTTAGLTPEHTSAKSEPLTHFYAFLADAQRDRDAESESRPSSRHHSSASSSVYSLRTALKSNLSVSTLNPGLIAARDGSAESLPLLPSHKHARPQHAPRAATFPAQPVAGHGNEGDASRYALALAPLLHRRLFFTEGGRLGLGPGGMREGDGVVVLFGGRVVYVVRRVEEGGEQGGGGGGERWMFVGECFVDEWMAGEGMAEERGWEWFELV